MRVPLVVASAALSLVTPLATASAAAYTFTELTFQASSAATVFNNEADGINNEGQVVGSSGPFNAFYPGEQGSVLNLATGNVNTLSSPPQFSALLPSKINDAGQIVGSALVGSGFYTTNGPTFLLDTTTGAFATYPSYPNYPYNFIANNNIGQIVANQSGNGRFNVPPFVQGFLLDTTTGTSIAVADPLAPLYTGPTALNDHGQVVGFFQVGSIDNGFLFDVATGNYTTLTVPQSVSTIAESINNVGQVVGYSYDASTSFSGFVLDLATDSYTTLTYPGSIFTVAEGINDAGQIVGYYRNSTPGAYHAFLATPVAVAAAVPEPSSVALLGGSLLIFGWARLRRRRGVASVQPEFAW